MKHLKFIVIALLLFGCKENNLETNKSKEMVIVEQDYHEALSIASQENKLLFIDFYTTWCAPCKKLDNWVFRNDSIKKLLGKDFVMLKYDAERDSTFHLSKKHHVSSYPTGIILNKEGFVVNRKYGFPGNDTLSLQKNVLEFTNESIALNAEKKVLKGYSNKIEAEKYPKFYTDYVNRTNTKINTSELNDYLNNTQDKLSEEYFSTLIYFGRNAPESIADMILENQQKYTNLYGKNDVEILLYFLTSAKFATAISELNQEKYDEAVKFAKNALNEGWANSILPSFEKDYLKAQNKWEEVFEINRKLKDKGEFDHDYINHFSWEVYKKCDNKQVIAKCIEWMKEVTDQESNYAYWDTYAHLMYKSGNKTETKRVTQLAIEAAKRENKSTKALEKLIQTM